MLANQPEPTADLGGDSSVRQATATDRVYDGIYRAMLERRLQPGEWLRESELAAVFEVSRTVVRQALQRLAQNQLVELLPNRGARLPLPEQGDITHVFEARRVAECEIARRLGGVLTGEQLDRLHELAEAELRALQSGDVTTAVRLSGEFHLLLAHFHGNPVFERLLDTLLPTTSMLMARFSAPGRPACVVHRHVELIAALRRSGPAAAAEMKQHLAELERSLTRSDEPQSRPLRDVFSAYREAAK